MSCLSCLFYLQITVKSTLRLQRNCLRGTFHRLFLSSEAFLKPLRDRSLKQSQHTIRANWSVLVNVKGMAAVIRIAFNHSLLLKWGVTFLCYHGF